MNYREEIKAIMFDYDGTLIDFDYQTTEYTRKALAELKNKDYKLCLCSGRPCFLALRAFKDVFGDYPLDYIFGCNGAEMMDVKNDRITLISPISAEDVRYLGSIIADDRLVMGIYDGTTFLVNHHSDDPEILKWMRARWLEPVIFDYLQNDKPRSKVLIINDPADRIREEKYLATLDLSRFNIAYSSPLCLEISAKDVSKADACDMLAEILHCENRNILSFGDGDNDIAMLRNSTGVIMGNADPRLQELIPLHTASVEKEGIYQFLKENYLL